MTVQGRSFKIAVFVHLFYTHSYVEFQSILSGLKNLDPLYLFNIGPSPEPHALIEQIKTDFPGALVLQSPNIGKDIGGKLALLDLYLSSGVKSDLFIFLHDKVSPQILNGEKWRNQLLKIVRTDTCAEIVNLFNQCPQLGLVGASEHLSNEYNPENRNFNSTNNLILKEYIHKFGLSLTDYTFIAGNMFWVRSRIYEDFFNKFRPLQLRAGLEKGNVTDAETGTHTHSLERIFSWIAQSQGYQIKGV